MNHKQYLAHYFVGGTIVLLGLLLNKWFLESYFSPDGSIEGLSSLLAIYLTQVSLLSFGVYLAWRKPKALNKTNIILVVASLVVGFILAEASARIVVFRLMPFDTARRYLLPTDIQNHWMYTHHHYLDYALTPNYQEGLTRHNSFGFRGPEISLRKPTGAYRIAVLGGSTTYTISVKDNAKTFTARLQRSLSSRFPRRHIEVIDAGVPDYTSWESLINLEFRVLDFDPDLVVVYHGVNDVQARLVEPSHYKGDNSGLRKQWSIPPIEWWEHSVILRILSRNLGLTRQPGLIDVIDADTSLGAERPRSEGVRFDPAEAGRLLPTLNSNLPVFFRRNLVSMIGVARAHNIKIMLATWAYCPCRNDYASTALYQTGFEQNNEVVRSVAGTFHVPMLDFVELMPREKRYWRDGRHVNEKGALVKAKIFADFIATHFLAK